MTETSPLSVTATTPAVRPAGAIVLSAGFWGCLVAASVLFGTVALAARVVEHARLERETAERQSELLTLNRDVMHLERVVRGLQSDASFAQTVARHALGRRPAGAIALPVGGKLRYDPREAAPDPIDVTWQAPWYLPILASVATSPQRQQRWSLIAAGLLAFGFVFLHENAGSRAAGRALAAPLVWLGRRYRRVRG